MAKEGKLNPIELKKLGAGFHADGNGLYLDVRPSGSRSWVLRTMVAGKRRDIGLGGFSTVSLAEAREEAGKLRSRAKKGEDVLQSRRIEKRVVPTFKQAAQTYHAQISETFDSELHAYNWLRSLEQYVFPVFGPKTVDVVDASDVLRAIGPIWTTVPDTARRTLRRIKVIFDHCQAAGYRNMMVGNLAVPLPNPCEGIRTALPNNHKAETHHGALDFRELPTFLVTMQKSTSSLVVKLAFEFLILTAARTGEVLEATWSEIDLEENLWTVPAKRMKMRQPHKVPLSDRCVEILELAKKFSDAEIVFPSNQRNSAPNPTSSERQDDSSSTSPPEAAALSNMCFLMTLRRMGLEDVTAHGFRATFKTWAEEKTKFDSLVIEASLAHAVKGIERHYLRTTFLEQRKKLMDAWATYATAAPTAKVVSIRR